MTKNIESKSLSTTRPRCPFYGFSYSVTCNTFDEQHGNQCACKTESFTPSPCKMELAGQEPNWDTCPFVTMEDRKSLEYMELARVYPKELPVDGISLKEWIYLVMIPNDQSH